MKIFNNISGVFRSYVIGSEEEKRNNVEIEIKLVKETIIRHENYIQI